MGIFFREKEKPYPEGLAEDTLLAYKAADGLDSAFETLVRKYERLVSTCVYSVVKNPEDTADVSQEIFLKVYKSIGSFKGDSEFSTWLYRIAKNTALDFVRKQKQSTLSIETGTVKSRLFRAREQLRKILLKENYF